jgi:hypothetical protein
VKTYKECCQEKSRESWEKRKWWEKTLGRRCWERKEETDWDLNVDFNK